MSKRDWWKFGNYRRIVQVGGLLWLTAGCGARTALSYDDSIPSLMPEVPSLPPPPSASAVPPASPLPPRTCVSVNLAIDDLRPTVTLLVDQSGSMDSRYPSNDSPETRWSVVRQALLDPKTGVVPGLQKSLHFGLAFYTSHNGFSGGTCPILNEVQSATDNYDAIVALYDRMSPDDDTPTGAAVQQVASEIQAAGRKSSEVLLLVTDGDPDTCAEPDPQNGQLEAIVAAERAHALGIDFQVLGVSADIAGDKLQQLANAGQGKPLSAVWGVDADAAQPFQASDSVQGLTAQLRAILARVPLCDVQLNRDVGDDEIRAASVILDGQQLAYASANGFQLKDSRHLQIVGKACDALRASGKRVTVRISCG